MDAKKLIADLEKNSEFKEWRKTSKKYYLAHIFAMLDEINKDSYQVGYSSPDCTKITTFIVSKDDIQIAPDNEVFKKPGTTIAKLDVSKIKIDSDEAMAKAEEHRKKSYKQDSPIKIFFIIQNLDLGQVYNVTFVTNTFKTINIKISATDGKILHSEATSLMDMRVK
jgi:Zn-dependent metalloprotease